mgnify:CR=1 FL=1|tara:strand:+ start:379 stop:741 length:363 start_codon:yes stop_codon:yes gene_type:complete
MSYINLDNTVSYDTYLRGEHHGKTPEARLDAANSQLDEKLSAIEKAKKRQLIWIMAGYGFGAAMSFMYWGGNSSGGIVVAMFMNLAAYHYGKLQFMPDAETHAFNQAVARWTKEGSPTYN